MQQNVCKFVFSLKLVLYGVNVTALKRYNFLIIFFENVLTNPDTYGIL